MSLSKIVSEVQEATDAGFVGTTKKRKGVAKMAAAHGAKIVAVRAIADAVGGSSIAGKLLATMARHTITKGIK